MKIEPPAARLRRGKQFVSELKRCHVYKLAVGESECLELE